MCIKVSLHSSLILFFFSYKNNELITYENERIAIISQNAQNTGYYELVIPEVKYSDAGIYKCVATNKFGDATCQGMVSVVGMYILIICTFSYKIIYLITNFLFYVLKTRLETSFLYCKNIFHFGFYIRD